MSNNQNKGEKCCEKCIKEVVHSDWFNDGRPCSCSCHTPQSVEKDTNSQDSIQVGNESIQTNTLGTTMEERFDNKFKPTVCNDLKELVKMSSNDRFVKNTQDLKDFIKKEISQSKAETIKEMKEKIKEIANTTKPNLLLNEIINLLSKDIEQ